MCLSQIYPTASVVSTTGCPNDDEVEKLSWIGFSNLKVSGNPGPHITSTTFSHWKKRKKERKCWEKVSSSMYYCCCCDDDDVFFQPFVFLFSLER